jgi:uncharacterized repeat protein (TIGR03806 family)
MHPSPSPWWLLFLLLPLGLVLGGLALAEGEEGGPPARVPGTIAFRGDPDQTGEYALVRAFPKLTFERPVWIGAPGDGSKRLFVAEQDGRIKGFERDPQVAEAKVALDLSRVVLRSHNEEGLLGLAFDPDFRRNGRLYVAYSRDEPRRLVVSQFLASGSRIYVRPSTEKEILAVRQPSGRNNGGCIAFGPDGHLYVSVGDGGLETDPQGNAQRLDSPLGKILRLDISGRKGPVPPADNPFVGARDARPDVWAYGFQNVRRFSFDRVTGTLWAGDTGRDRLEEVNVVRRGENHGWNLREGRLPFAEGMSLVPLVDPVLEVPRADARSIVGGVVYRGKALPRLNGSYLYGDLETGNVWSLRWDGSVVKENVLLGRGIGVTHFGEDEEGEVYLTSLDGSVHRLEARARAGEEAFPTRLSETGLYADTAGLVPSPQMIPYSLNVPLWSDGAAKERHFVLPGRERIHVGDDGRFAFPDGTLFVKTFYLGDPAEGARLGRRLETRVLLRRGADWAGYTYVWNEAQSDAILIDERVTLSVESGRGEQEHFLDWTFPSRTDCMGCHTSAANRVLGFRREQLDRTVASPAGPRDQFEILAAMEVFDRPVAAGGPRWPDWEDPQADLVASVRAYLDANCAMCHQPTGPGNANIDLRWDTPLAATNLVNQRPGQWDLGVYGARLVVPGDPKQSLL